MLAACAMDARLESRNSRGLVAATEAAGASFPRVLAGAKAQPLPDSAVGTSERKCVEANGTKQVRSGEFVAGPFALYGQNWPRFGKVWWAPLYPNVQNDRLPPARITATRLNYRAQTYTKDLETTAWGGGWFYPSGFLLPWYGRWMIVVTAGENWGCFLYTL
jgi:hypothetical protein